MYIYIKEDREKKRGAGERKRERRENELCDERTKKHAQP